MAQFKNSPPPDWGGWRDDPLYFPRSDPLSGGYDPGEDYDELTAPVPSAPPRSTTPFGQFLPSLLDAVARLPQPAPPGRFLPSIGVHLPPPQTVLATRRYDPPPPPLTPLEPPADYTSLTVPKPMVGPQSTERVAGFGTTPAPLPAGFERTQGDGVLMNAVAGASDGVYGTLGGPADALNWTLNRGVDVSNYFRGTDSGYFEDPWFGSRWFARRGTALGIPDPESIIAVTPTEKIARGAGEVAAYVAAPAALARGGVAAMRAVAPVAERMGSTARELPSAVEAIFGRASSARQLGRDAAAEATTPFTATRAVPRDVPQTAIVVRPKAASASTPRRIDYSEGFEDDLINFMPGAELREGVLDADLKLISYHADTPLGNGRSAKWWTTTDAGNSFSTMDEAHQALALPLGWGPREVVSHMTIPKGETIRAYFGRAAEQKENGMVYRGGAPQFRLEFFDRAWPITQRRIP